MQIIKIIFLAISCVGYYLYLKRKATIKEEFIPIFVISIIGITVYFSGILNLMKLITYLIGIGGVLLFIKNLYEILKNKEKIKFNVNIIIFVLLIVWSAWILKGTILTHYDNFSHWAMIIKEMIKTDKLPNFLSTTILFNSYPPGTACFVYFICKYLGNSESIMLFAQSILILASSYAIFAFCNKESKINYIIAILTILYWLISNIFINQLLVDTVLPVMGISVLAIIIYYRKDLKKGLFYAIPVLALLMIVKNSGVFFVIIDLIIWLIFAIKNNGIKSLFKQKCMILIFLPVIVQVIWSAHTDLVFDNSRVTKHSMSVENYINNIENKEESDFNTILEGIISKITLLKNKDNQILIILFGAFILMAIISIKNKDLRSFIIKMFIFYVISYIFYVLSLFGMYMFSMSGSEAISLAGYDRYFKTMVMFNYGIFIVTAMVFINEYKFDKKYNDYILKLIILLVVALPICFYNKAVKQLYVKDNSQNATRNLVSSYKNNYNIEEEKSYLLYVDEQKAKDDYLYYICKYEFRSKNIKVIDSLSELENTDKVFDYDYLIIMNKTDEILEFLDIIGGDLDLNVIRFR